MTFGDRLVLLAAIVLVGWLYVMLWQSPEPGSRVRIKRDQHVLKEVSLDSPQQIHVTGELGDSIIEIRDHQVRFEQSPCTNQICVLHGWFHHSGEVMACLPNHIIVEVTGAKQKFDAISF